MKKLSISLIIVITTMIFHTHAQVKMSDGVNINSQNNQNYEPATYRLFSTQNTWTFIKLDTRNGMMWQIQWSTESDKRFATSLNLLPLVAKGNEKDNRFTLYPTQNIYNFILVDQIDGRTWQVQWSIDPDKRLVIPVY